MLAFAKNILFTTLLLTGAEKVYTQENASDSGQTVKPERELRASVIGAGSPKRDGKIDYNTLSMARDVMVPLNHLKDKVLQSPKEYFDMDYTLSDALDSAYARKNNRVSGRKIASMGLDVSAFIKGGTTKEVSAVGIIQVTSYETESEGSKYLITDTTEYVDKDKDGFLPKSEMMKRVLTFWENKGSDNEVFSRCEYRVMNSGNKRLRIDHKDPKQTQDDPANAQYSVLSAEAAENYTKFVQTMAEEFYRAPAKALRYSVEELKVKY